MVLLDPVTGAIGAIAMFLIVLGVLVLFVETVRPIHAVSVVLGDGVLSFVLFLLGEAGIAFLILGFGAAVIANQVFEWLTTR